MLKPRVETKPKGKEEKQVERSKGKQGNRIEAAKTKRKRTEQGRRKDPRVNRPTNCHEKLNQTTYEEAADP